jgi:hypothetical protein
VKTQFCEERKLPFVVHILFLQVYFALTDKILSQILLLKTGSFELAIIRMSRLIDLSQNSVLYGEVMLPQEAFYTTNNVEMKLVAGIFETAKTIAELKLTETELALYQSLVLLWPGKYCETFQWYCMVLTTEIHYRTIRCTRQYRNLKTFQHEYVSNQART